MKGVIYCYHCIPTGKKYIGQTISEKTRKRNLLNYKKKHVRIWYKIIKFYNKNAQSIKNVHLTNMFLNGID